MLQHSLCRSDVRPVSLPQAPAPGSTGPAPPPPGPASWPGPAPSPGGPGRRDKCRAGPRQPEEQEGAGGARETPVSSAAHGSLSGWRALYFFLREGLKRKGGEKRHSGQGPTLTSNNPLTLYKILMQMTERLVTKAAASAARAQPAESRDRKYDKHLSYSATWGRSAVRAGSRGGSGGGCKNTTPRRGVHATHGAFETGVPGGRVCSWDTPRRLSLRTQE